MTLAFIVTQSKTLPLSFTVHVKKVAISTYELQIRTCAVDAAGTGEGIDMGLLLLEVISN